MSINYGSIDWGNKLGDRGQDLVYHLLGFTHGRKVHMGVRSGPRADKWDILVDGRWHIEVKTAAPRKVGANPPTWFFNIHRHGLVDESKVDFYVLRLEDVPYCKYPIHLLLPSPIGKPTVAVSFRALVNGYGRFAEAFRRFAKTGMNPFTQAGELECSTLTQSQ